MAETPKWLEDDSTGRPNPKYHEDKKSQRVLADIREQRVADIIRGRKVPGSGSSPFAKGDVRDIKYGFLLLEQKGTGNRTMRIEYNWFKKITKEAREAGRVPGVVLSWDKALEPEDTIRPPVDWCALPLSFVKKLLDLYQEVADAG